MSKRAYVTSFMILDFAFAPVCFYACSAPVFITSPCSYIAFVTLSKTVSVLSEGFMFWLLLDGAIWLSLALYCFLFYLGARFTFHISDKAPKLAGKFVFQFVMLALLFSSSFLNVIHSDYFVNETGAIRFLKT